MAQPEPAEQPMQPHLVLFETDPAHYRYWQLSIAGRIATLTLQVPGGH